MITYSNMIESVIAYCLANKCVWLHLTNAQLVQVMRIKDVPAWAARHNLEHIQAKMNCNDGYKFRSV